MGKGDESGPQKVSREAAGAEGKPSGGSAAALASSHLSTDLRATDFGGVVANAGTATAACGLGEDGRTSRPDGLSSRDR